MGLRNEQCEKVCRIIDDVLANRPTERDSLIVAVQIAFETLERMSSSSPNYSESPNGWIPCSIKKHPDSKIECYVTVKDYTDNYGEEYDLILDEDTYYPEHDAWDYYCDLDIIAWMPKNEPKEPYQPKEDES